MRMMRSLDNTEESGSASKRTAGETEIDKLTQELCEIHGLESGLYLSIVYGHV